MPRNNLRHALPGGSGWEPCVAARPVHVLDVTICTVTTRVPHYIEALLLSGLVPYEQLRGIPLIREFATRCARLGIVQFDGEQVTIPPEARKAWAHGRCVEKTGTCRVQICFDPVTRAFVHVPAAAVDVPPGPVVDIDAPVPSPGTLEEREAILRQLGLLPVEADVLVTAITFSPGTRKYVEMTIELGMGENGLSIEVHDGALPAPKQALLGPILARMLASHALPGDLERSLTGHGLFKEVHPARVAMALVAPIPGAKFIDPGHVQGFMDAPPACIIDFDGFCGTFMTDVVKTADRIVIARERKPGIEWAGATCTLSLPGDPGASFAIFDGDACLPVEITGWHGLDVCGFLLLPLGSLARLPGPGFSAARVWRTTLATCIDDSLPTALGELAEETARVLLETTRIAGTLLDHHPATWIAITRAVAASLRSRQPGTGTRDEQGLLAWKDIVPANIAQPGSPWHAHLPVVIDVLHAFMDVAGITPCEPGTGLALLHDWFNAIDPAAHVEAIASRMASMAMEAGGILPAFSFLSRYVKKPKRRLPGDAMQGALLAVIERCARAMILAADMEAFATLHAQIRDLVQARPWFRAIENRWNGEIAASVADAGYLEDPDPATRRKRHQLAITVMLVTGGYNVLLEDARRLVHESVAGLEPGERRAVLSWLAGKSGRGAVARAIHEVRGFDLAVSAAGPRGGSHAVPIKTLLRAAPRDKHVFATTLLVAVAACLAISVPDRAWGATGEALLVLGVVLIACKGIVLVSCVVIAWKGERDGANALLPSGRSGSLRTRFLVASAMTKWLACTIACVAATLVVLIATGMDGGDGLPPWVGLAVHPPLASAIVTVAPVVPILQSRQAPAVPAAAPGDGQGSAATSTIRLAFLAFVCFAITVAWFIIHAIASVGAALYHNHVAALHPLVLQAFLFLSPFFGILLVLILVLGRAIPAIHERLARLLRRRHHVSLTGMEVRATRVPSRRVIALACMVLASISFVHGITSSLLAGQSGAAQLAVGGDAWLGSPGPASLEAMNPYTLPDLQRMVAGAAVDGQPLVDKASWFRKAIDLAYVDARLAALGLSIDGAGWARGKGSLSLLIIDPATYPATGLPTWTRPGGTARGLLDQLQAGGIILHDELAPVLGVPAGSNVTLYLEGTSVTLQVLGYLDAIPGVAASAGLAGRDPSPWVAMISRATYQRVVDRLVSQARGIRVEIPYGVPGNPYADDAAHRHYETLFMPIDRSTILSRLDTWEYRSAGIISRAVPQVIDAIPRNSTFRSGSAVTRGFKDAAIVAVPINDVFEPEPCEFIDFGVPPWKRDCVQRVLEHARDTGVRGCVVNDHYVERRLDGTIISQHDFSPGDVIAISTGAGSIDFTVVATIRAHDAHVNGSAGAPLVKNPRALVVNPYANASTSWVARGLACASNTIIISENDYCDVLRQTLSTMQGKMASGLPWYAPGGGNILTNPWYTEMMKFMLDEHEFATGFRFDFAPSVPASMHAFYAASLQAHLRGASALQNATCFLPGAEYKRVMRVDAGGAWVSFTPAARGKPAGDIMAAIAGAHGAAGLPFDEARAWLASSVSTDASTIQAASAAAWWWTGILATVMIAGGYHAGRERASLVSLVHASMAAPRRRAIRVAFSQATGHAIAGMVAGLLAGWGLATAFAASFPFMAALPLGLPAMPVAALLAALAIATAFVAGLIGGVTRTGLATERRPAVN
ncbi:MAG: hypothetical protein GYA24_10705 [Candidatus Lokiarchaeota archaeon]|nr:hypothetical protein [Candidatus Lokiarchaeota archaeon]